jgi:hypothetical protein
MTQEPPDSACEIKRIHSVAFTGINGTVTFGYETKRPLEGRGYTPDLPERSPGAQSIYAQMGAPMPIWQRYTVTVENRDGGTVDMHLSETQLKALLRSVRAAFLKDN